VSSELLTQAADAYRAGDLTQAEALAEQACEADMTNEQAVLMYSGLLLHQKATSRAEALLRRALAAGLDSGPARANLALSLNRQDEHTEAAELARSVTEAQPALISAWNTLGAALLALDEPAQAEDEILKGLAAHPEHPALTLLLGHARRAQARDDEAEESYRQFDRSGQKLIQQAEMLALSGRLIEAEHQYRQLLATQPRNPVLHAGLGRLLLRMDQPEQAAEALQQALRLDSTDPTSRHFLRVAQGQPSNQADPDYVRALFDDYADQFDQSLVETLGYRIPEEMTERLLEAGADLSEVLDLGCGTGLVARALAGRFGVIDGVDLSAAMLKQAEGGGHYRTLAHQDVVDFLRDCRSQYTTVVAADIMIYVGDFKRLLEPLARKMPSGGHFIFSIELSDGAPLSLNSRTGRYQHHPDGIDQVLSEQGFTAADWTMTTIRQEVTDRIPGAIGLARRR